jgi:hypothetical protein
MGPPSIFFIWKSGWCRCAATTMISLLLRLVAVHHDFIIIFYVFHFIQMASTAQSSYTQSMIDSHAYEKESEVSDVFADVFEYVTDVLKIYYSACAKPDKFEDFINSVSATEENNICSPWKTNSGQKSLIIMVLTAYATAWDMVMASIENRQDVSDLYGVVLSCFIEDGMTYVAKKKSKALKSAEQVCAAKLRNAIAHLEKSKLVQQETPWVMEFSTDYDGESHSFKITPREFCNFLRLFHNISRFGFLTEAKITKMLKRIVSNDMSFPEKLRNLFGK